MSEILHMRNWQNDPFATAVCSAICDSSCVKNDKKQVNCAACLALMGKERIRELEATPPRRDAMQDIFAPLNAAANAQNLDLPILVYDAGAGVEIVSVKQKQGASLWAVRFGQNVLSKTGQWEWEPMPSNRNENFLSRCRFATAQEALECLAGAR